MKINSRQSAFVESYVKTANAADACRQAGYSVAEGTSACALGNKLLKNPKVQAAIAQRISTKQRLDRNIGRVVGRLAALAAEGKGNPNTCGIVLEHVASMVRNFHGAAGEPPHGGNE